MEHVICNKDTVSIPQTYFWHSLLQFLVNIVQYIHLDVYAKLILTENIIHADELAGL